MINLAEHTDFMQNISEIMASLFGLEITIVDRNYLRVSGTDRYKDTVGKTIVNHHVFRYVMEKNKTVSVDDPGVDIACFDCPSGGTCGKTAAIYAPITVDNVVIGGLALVAFNTEQKGRLVNNRLFFQFVEQLSYLISSKLEAEHNSTMLEDALKKNIAILNAVHDGVMAVDYNGNIEQVNHSLKKFMGLEDQSLIGRHIREFLSPAVIDDIVDHNRSFVDKEVEIKIQNKKIPVYLTAHPVNKKTLSGATVLSFKSAQEITYLAKNFTTTGNQPITFEDIVGNSDEIESVKTLARKVAIGDSSVLIRGESGTGKELFARALHYESIRSNGPFIAVNCAAIPEPLLESELFGYEEGAFTGARRGGKPGKCEMAIGGTLFLDEVGDIPLFIQSKFLRMIQERTIERVGGNKTIPIDVRIISATHRNLESMIENREFREDLYYRLNVIPLNLPPLSERPEDIFDLSMYFLDKYAKRLNKSITQISDETLDILSHYKWPGNIRELENSIEYAVNVETSDSITADSLPQRILMAKQELATKSTISTPKPNSFKDAVKNAEYTELTRILDEFGWSTPGKQDAAEHLGISIATLYRRLKKYGIS
jgi:PAS domain S-box-containing protein